MSRRQKKIQEPGLGGELPIPPPRGRGAPKSAAKAAGNFAPIPDTATPLKVLILAHPAAEASTIEQALRSGGVSFSVKHAATRIAFMRGLHEFEPDLVLCSYHLPDFNGLPAVKLVRLQSAALPIIVTGGELAGEDAAALMRAGASDFVQTDHLARLPQAVQRAMAEAEAVKAGFDTGAELSREKERFHALLDASETLCWIADADGHVTGDLPGWRKFTGLTLSQIRGNGWWHAVHPDDRRGAKTAWRQAVRQGVPFACEIRVCNAEGEYSYFLARALPVRDKDGAICEWLGICFDITAQKQRDQERAEVQQRTYDLLRSQAVRDPLTGLFNRHYLQETMPRECRQALRRRTPFCVAMLDIDNFKLFNDHHGHQAGDKILKELGKLLLTTVRTSDIVCRYGGEEFLLVLLDAELALALTSLERICEEVKRRQVVYRGYTLPNITLSAGIAQFPVHGTSTTDLLRAADHALYAAKAGGRDRIVISSSIPVDRHRR
jgi:diguanylate cyclase (GGDEF)-like protein/PAS domain S-box-containing protein